MKVMSGYINIDTITLVYEVQGTYTRTWRHIPAHQDLQP